MTEFEASQMAFQLIEFTHNLGEGIQVRIEFWSTISYGLILLAYVAPERLNIAVCALLLALYGLFSLNMLDTIGEDIQTIFATHQDALALLDQYQLSLQSVRVKAEMTSEQMRTSRGVTFLYVPGLFFATVAYVLFTAVQQRRLRIKAQ